MSYAMTGSGRSAMRHDPASAAIVVMLRSLKMFGMAQAASELIAGATILHASFRRVLCFLCSFRLA